ncbi:carbohydrate ABC transporter permease [Dethiothermospora halolimnae]|uniref:carbohydrate ABC transporter permease n=1 Tax=Dethiothermospora halolimnae TaxID=3114390 RepID=UPI003CCBE0FA
MKRLLIFIIIVIALMYIYPIIFTFTNSFMTEGQIVKSDIELIPQEFNLQQYYSIITEKAEYFKFFLNSVKLTAIIIIGQIIIGILAAYAFAKINFKGRDIIFAIYIMAVLLPFQVTLVPNYLIFDKIDRILNIQILDTHLSIILPGIFSSFGVFLLRQFIRGIPDEVIEAARIDGAGYGRILFKIILPLLKPAIFSLVILTFIDNWNLIEQAIIFIDTPKKLPLSVFLDSIYHEDHGVFFAGSVLYIIPAIIIFIKGEKYLKEGLIVGGSK